MKPIDVYDLDRFMALKPADEGGVRWLLPFEPPLRLAGLNWFGEDMRYSRFPEKGLPARATRFDPEGRPDPCPFPECGAAQLAGCTAGAQLQFRTDSSRILLKGEVQSPGGMDHMAFTGSAGFDLYLTEEGGRRRMAGVSRFDHSGTEFSVEIVGDLQPGMREVLVHFPLYNGVKHLYVGIDGDAQALPPRPWTDDAPVVVYGTSITQGGCASRPGMAYPSILSRWLNREVLNFGFSGNGRGEPEIAELIARVEDPAAFLVDYDWNIQSDREMAATLPTFLDVLRARHPRTPILVLSHTPSGPWSQKRRIPSPWPGKTRVQRQEVERRRRNGDPNILFIDGTTLLGDDWDECLVDGCHHTDLGFYRMAEALLPILKQALGTVRS